jgi:hypothetical protein
MDDDDFVDVEFFDNTVTVDNTVKHNLGLLVAIGYHATISYCIGCMRGLCLFPKCGHYYYFDAPLC